VTTIALHL